MERETQEIKVGDHTFKVKSYATAREVNLIQQAYFKGTKVEVVGQQPKFSDFNPNVQYEVKLECIRQMVVEMDGKTEDIVARCEELPADVFDELTGTIDAIAAKKKQ